MSESSGGAAAQRREKSFRGALWCGSECKNASCCCHEGPFTLQSVEVTRAVATLT
jgi:hypothetical protein